jgi:hypothetical protein
MTSREKTILVITGGLIVVSLLHNFVVEPFLKQDARLNAEISASRMKLKKSLVLLGHKDFLLAKYPRLSSDVMASGNAARGATAVLAELDGLAKGAHLTILDVRPETSGERRKGREINVEMRAEGKVEEIFRFLYVRPHSQVLEAKFSVVSTDAAQPSGVVPANKRRDSGWERD